MKGRHFAVPPDVHGAGHADGGEGQHQRTQPDAVVIFDDEPQVREAGCGSDDGTESGVQYGSGAPDPYCTECRCHGKCLAVAVTAGARFGMVGTSGMTVIGGVSVTSGMAGTRRF